MQGLYVLWTAGLRLPLSHAASQVSPFQADCKLTFHVSSVCSEVILLFFRMVESHKIKAISVSDLQKAPICHSFSCLKAKNC